VALFLIVLSRRVGEKSITIDLGLVAIFGIPLPLANYHINLIRRVYSVIDKRRFISLIVITISRFHLPNIILAPIHPHLDRHPASEVPQ